MHHPAIQLDGGVEGGDIRRGEHDLLSLLSTVEARASHGPNKLQRVLKDMWIFPDGPL